MEIAFNSRLNRIDMAPWKLIRTKEYEALRNEAKGYYGETEKANEYLEAIGRQMQGLALPDLSTLSREKIRKAYETMAPVMGVVNYIADNVGDVATYYELTKDGEIVESHPLLETLARPNDRFNLRKFVTAWAVNRLLFGDAWVYVTRRIGKEGGWNLYVIPSHRVAVKNGQSQPMVEGVRLLGVPEPKTISIAEMFESFDYNLDDTSFFGSSKVVAAANYLGVMDKGIRRQDTTLETGGATHVITPKGDESGVLPQHIAELEKLMNGAKSTGKRKFFKLPIEVHQLGNTPVDLSILDSHKEAVTALCFVYRLPVDLYYGQAKYENAKEAKKTIYEQNAIPMANEFAEDLLHHLGMDKEGYKLTVNTDKIDVLKASTGEVLDNLSKMYASLNERREAYGYDRFEETWADQPILPLGVAFGNEYAGLDINEE